MTTKRLGQLLFANSYLCPFEQSFFFQWLGPFLKPVILRLVRRDYLQAWSLLFLAWGLAMASLPTLQLLVSQLIGLLSWFNLVPGVILAPLSTMLNIGFTMLEVWGVYYVGRLTLTKLYYWREDKYPAWPTNSILYQIDRYIFRPEFFSFVLVTLFWIQLTNFLVTSEQIHFGQVDWVLYVELWVPWMGGALWPVVSIFFHKQLLEI